MGYIRIKIAMNIGLNGSNWFIFHHKILMLVYHLDIMKKIINGMLNQYVWIKVIFVIIIEVNSYLCSPISICVYYLFLCDGATERKKHRNKLHVEGVRSCSRVVRALVQFFSVNCHYFCLLRVLFFFLF